MFPSLWAAAFHVHCLILTGLANSICLTLYCELGGFGNDRPAVVYWSLLVALLWKYGNMDRLAEFLQSLYLEARGRLCSASSSSHADRPSYMVLFLFPPLVFETNCRSTSRLYRPYMNFLQSYEFWRLLFSIVPFQSLCIMPVVWLLSLSDTLIAFLLAYTDFFHCDLCIHTECSLIIGAYDVLNHHIFIRSSTVRFNVIIVSFRYAPFLTCCSLKCTWKNGKVPFQTNFSSPTPSFTAYFHVLVNETLKIRSATLFRPCYTNKNSSKTS